MAAELDAYDELRCYTLTRGDAAFVHQHAVDAFTAQHASAQSKPIAVAFALVGLYLCVERQFSGRQVQRVHTRLARRKQRWPAFALPAARGSLTVVDVLAAPAGSVRDEAIHAWCASVWNAFRESRPAVIALLRQHGVDDSKAPAPPRRPRRP